MASGQPTGAAHSALFGCLRRRQRHSHGCVPLHQMVGAMNLKGSRLKTAPQDPLETPDRESPMTPRAHFRQSVLERGIRAAKKHGVALIVEPSTGRMIFDVSEDAKLAASTKYLELSPNPWEEGIKDATP